MLCYRQHGRGDFYIGGSKSYNYVGVESAIPDWDPSVLSSKRALYLNTRMRHFPGKGNLPIMSNWSNFGNSGIRFKDMTYLNGSD